MSDLYSHVGDGTYESVTWEYDWSVFDPGNEQHYADRAPTTTSIKPTGTVKVGDTLDGYPHMTAIEVRPF